MICVFDLDGTLAEIGKSMTGPDTRLLRSLSHAGHTIVICSGKPTYYLCGFMRQTGIPDCILIGENGAAIQFGVDLPPVRHYRLPTSKIAIQNLVKLKTLLNEIISPEMWYQPNEVCLTPFPRSEKEFDRIQTLLDAHPDLLEGLQYYRHCDSIDFAPKEVNKGSALAYLCELLGESPDHFLAVGDGVNDAPMFRFCGTALGVHFPDPRLVDHNFPNLTKSLEFILSHY